MSEFRKWFKEQYGALPTDGKLSMLSIELEHAQRKVREIATAMHAEERLHEKWQDALYGWNASRRKDENERTHGAG